MKKLVLSLTAAMLFAGGYEVGVGVGRSNVSSAPLKNHNFLNLRIGKYLPKNHLLRLEFEKSNKVLGSNKLSRILLNVEHYFDYDKFRPYLFVGGGLNNVDGSYDDNFVANVGGGVKYNLQNNLSAFLEARFLRDFDNSDNYYSMLLGIAYKFGFASKVSNNQEKDSDGDGVIDSLDKCPNTPANYRVDSNGCIADSDGDGVADNLDACPNTPKGYPVDESGCPKDSDGDGVIDALDKCPNTPKGFGVDENGCAIKYNFMILFDTNKAVIKPEYMDRVKEFAKFLKEHKNAKAEIQGYTDSMGDAEYNKKLSLRRAKAVYEALIKLGVDKDRLSYKGFGEENPIASNDTPEGRAQNRRVIAIIIYK
jgi:OOP family OmpA-OmpF porin